MKVTKEMICAAHDICLKKGDFVLSANLLERIYLAMDSRSETGSGPMDEKVIDIVRNGSQMTAQREAELELDNLRLREALSSIRRYGNDTLSGRIDGIDDRNWQRDGVMEMTRRAREAMDDTPPPTEALSALVEKVEKLTIERCAEQVTDSLCECCWTEDQHAAVEHAETAIRALPTGQIKLEDLL